MSEEENPRWSTLGLSLAPHPAASRRLTHGVELLRFLLTLHHSAASRLHDRRSAEHYRTSSMSKPQLPHSAPLIAHMRSTRPGSSSLQTAQPSLTAMPCSFLRRTEQPPQDTRSAPKPPPSLPKHKRFKPPPAPTPSPRRRAAPCSANTVPPRTPDRDNTRPLREPPRERAPGYPTTQ